MFDPPPFRFTRHAKNRLRELRRRGLTEQDAIDAIVYADQTTPSVKGRFNAWKHFPGVGWITVTYVQEGSATTIVTVTRRQHGPSEVEQEPAQ